MSKIVIVRNTSRPAILTAVQMEEVDETREDVIDTFEADSLSIDDINAIMQLTIDHHLKGPYIGS